MNSLYQHKLANYMRLIRLQPSSDRLAINHISREKQWHINSILLAVNKPNQIITQTVTF